MKWRVDDLMDRYGWKAILLKFSGLKRLWEAGVGGGRAGEGGEGEMGRGVVGEGAEVEVFVF